MSILATTILPLVVFDEALWSLPKRNPVQGIFIAMPETRKVCPSPIRIANDGWRDQSFLLFNL